MIVKRFLPFFESVAAWLPERTDLNGLYLFEVKLLPLCLVQAECRLTALHVHVSDLLMF